MKIPTEDFEKLMMDYMKGNLSSEDLQILTELLRNDSSCRKKYQELAGVYGVASAPWFEGRRVQNWKQLRLKLNIHSFKERSLYKQLWIWRIAAVLLLIVSLSTFYYQNSHGISQVDIPVAYCLLESPAGTQSKLILPDSTVVCLNGNSVLKYDASSMTQGQLRSVYLTGEAYFEVTKNLHKPFLVHTEELDIKVLGTTFNVNAYPEESDIKVSLVEGKVDVYSNSKVDNIVTLSPNEQAIFTKKNEQIEVVKIDASQQSAWVTGRLVFINETLQHILEIIAKKYNVQMQIHSRKVFVEYFSGSIDVKLGLDEILSYIDVDDKFQWSRNGNKVIITDK